MTGAKPWPSLDYAAWRDTALTLQLWTQIVGKVRLALTPWVNHGWQVPLYVSARGLTTSAVPAGGGLIEIEFDFGEHRLLCRSSNGEMRALLLRPRSVADFYRELTATLADMGVGVSIDRMPNELADPVRFDLDEVHVAYDGKAAQRFWRTLVAIEPVFQLFRTSFLGKVSPVHFFWGSFDLAVTRFSGRRAPLHPGGVPGLPDRVTREAYSHEVSSAGFWPGNETFPEAAFYSYAWPEPPGFRQAQVSPPARFDTTLQEFILPYEAVRTSADSEGLLLGFLQTTYAAAADRGGWDRAALECAPGIAGVPRPVE